MKIEYLSRVEEISEKVWAPKEEIVGLVACFAEGRWMSRKKQVLSDERSLEIIERAYGIYGREKMKEIYNSHE